MRKLSIVAIVLGALGLAAGIALTAYLIISTGEYHENMCDADGCGSGWTSDDPAVLNGVGVLMGGVVLLTLGIIGYAVSRMRPMIGAQPMRAPGAMPSVAPAQFSIPMPPVLGPPPVVPGPPRAMPPTLVQ